MAQGGPGRDQGRSPGNRGHKGEKARGEQGGEGKGPGPSEPNVTSVCLIIATVIVF